MSFAKALASQFPRGVNVVAEVDFYYPLQTKIEEWYPKEPIHHKSDDDIEPDMHLYREWTQNLQFKNDQQYWVSF